MGVVGVDPVRLAERADLLHGLVARPGEPDALLLAEHLDQRLELRPPREHEPAVAAAGAAAADVRLDDDDVEVGLALLQVEGRPQAGVAAADDDDVGPLRALGRWRVAARLARERLDEPQRAARVTAHPPTTTMHMRLMIGGSGRLRAL